MIITQGLNIIISNILFIKFNKRGEEEICTFFLPGFCLGGGVINTQSK